MRAWLRPTSTKRMFFFLGVDLLLSLFTLYFAYALRFNFHIPELFLHSFWLIYLLVVSFKIGVLYWFKTYHIVWRFFGFFDAKNILKAHLVAYGLIVLFYLFFSEHFAPFPRSVIVIDLFLSLIFIGAIRVSKRLFLEPRHRNIVKPTLILGVNSKTARVIQSAFNDEIAYYPVSILGLEEDETTTDSYIHNIQVHHFSKLVSEVKKKQVSAAILTQTIPQKRLKEIVKQLNDVGIREIKQVKLLGSKDEKLESLSIEDLLARHPQDLDKEAIASFVKGKTILITGAGGSIGSEISKQCHAFGAKALILVDHSEYNLYQIGEHLPKATLSLLNVTQKPLLEKLFSESVPDIVIHAAAYKHVPMCENNQEMAVLNNVLGTKNVIDVSIASGVDKVVIISTDKAVRPTNVMGATKRVTELYANNVVSKSTEIVAVRFGNVLGSSGSVIPKFKAQIEQGGPVTVTHPEITRYFMLIPEACQLVLQTAAIAKGGELFVLDMGEPIKIVDLAKQMIRLYGKEDEVEICFTGLREGEKLYEELLLDESEKQTQYPSIFVAKATPYPITQLLHDIRLLLEAKEKVPMLKTIVPEFKRE